MADRTTDQKTHDYLDHPPQRWHQLGANGAFVERSDGEWVKHADMDLYMFEGSELMKQAIETNQQLREQLRTAVPAIATLKETREALQIALNRIASGEPYPAEIARTALGWPADDVSPNPTGEKR